MKQALFQVGMYRQQKKRVTLNGLIIQRSAKYICIPIYLYTHIIYIYIYIYIHVNTHIFIVCCFFTASSLLKISLKDYMYSSTIYKKVVFFKLISVDYKNFIWH